MRSRRKVLVIDDEARIVDIIDTFFRANGLSVRKAYDGRKGLNVLKKDSSIGLVILDEKMPGFGGTEFLRKVKELDIKVPVIVLSGSINLSQLDDSVKKLYQKIFIKPVRLSELLKVSSRMLDKTGKK